MLGVVLAGGRSSRMGGRDKALIRLADRTLLDYALAALDPHCVRVAVSAGPDPGRLTFLGRPVLTDGLAGHAGPMVGIVAALDWAATFGNAAGVATVPVDSPFLPLDLVPRLVEASRARGGRPAVAANSRRRHPVAAFWPADIRAEVRRLVLDGGERRVSAVLDRLDVVETVWPAVPNDPFMNINTEQDLAEARRLIGNRETS